MLHQPGVTERLATFVTATRWSDLPKEVAHAAKRSLLNFFAVALTGCRNETFEIALKTLNEFSGGRQATLIGRRERIDALSAAFLNAAGANVLDFCDTHVPTAIHPTAPLAPALLAVAELQRVSGRDLLLAFVLGQEVECRVGLAMSPSHYNRGWHITATCGVFGAAAGSGKLLALSPQQMVWALGSAATQASGLCECLGTAAKSVGVGNSARGGLLSALLAAKDFAGPAEPLTGTQGYYNALNETPNLALLADGLGETWEILKTSYKPYPCGFVLHPVLDCVLDWRRDNPGCRVGGSRSSAIHCSDCAPTGRKFRPARNRRSACSTPLPPRLSPARPASNSSRRLASTTPRSRRCAARSKCLAMEALPPSRPRSRSSPPTAGRINYRKLRRAAAT